MKATDISSVIRKWMSDREFYENQRLKDESIEFILRELIDRLQADPAVNVDLSDLQNRFKELKQLQKPKGTK